MTSRSPLRGYALAAHVGAAYAVQARLYGLAVSRMAGVTDRAGHERRIGGLIYYFLRGGAAHIARPTWDELTGGAAALLELVSPAAPVAP
jgi:exodeoxyribonuclease V beta subunit